MIRLLRLKKLLQFFRRPAMGKCRQKWIQSAWIWDEKSNSVRSWDAVFGNGHGGQIASS